MLTDALPTAEGVVRISTARGESEAGQVAFRSDAPVKALGISVKPLAGERRGRRLDAVGAVFLNYHLLEQATQPAIEGEHCAKPPVMVPDAFCTENPVPLPANTMRSAWIIVRVPDDSWPGLYKGTVALDADGTKAQVPIEVRPLHWYNYKFGLTGFLHWGYNAKFPPANVEKVIMDGDANLVYKDPLGMPVPSIRQGAMRDGIEDYELLKAAEARDKALARKLCDHLVTDCRLYTRDIADFRGTRELLLELAGAKSISPELRARISALPTDHGWLLKDLPDAPPSAEGWKLVFSDDFGRQELGPDWLPVCGQWAIKDGHLTTLKDGDAAIVYAKPLAPSQRIEYDAWTDRGYPCDLSAILCANPKLRNAFGSAYFFGLGSEMNAFSKLLINLVEHRIIPLRMVPGKRYHVICERDGDRLSFWVDGKVVLHSLHRDRLDGPDNRHAGLYMYLPGQFVDNVRLYAR